MFKVFSPSSTFPFLNLQTYRTVMPALTNFILDLDFDGYDLKVAIPVVPTVRVLITFTKFVELQPLEEQFFTPFSSPRHLFNGRGTACGDEDDDDNDVKGIPRASVSSSVPWLSSSGSRSGILTQKVTPQVADPFVVPIGYAWSSFDEKGKKMKKSKSSSNRKSK